MKAIDFSGMIIMYNLAIGMLVMLSSEKLGAYAGRVSRSHRERIARLTRVSSFTPGACVATLSTAVYTSVHLLKIGV